MVVRQDARATVSFDVRCAPATTGGFTISGHDSGSGAGPRWLCRSRWPAGDIRTIGPNASETFHGLVPGVHLVTLKDLDEPCAVAGGNPQPFTVVPGKAVLVRLDGGLRRSCPDSGRGPSDGVRGQRLPPARVEVHERQDAPRRPRRSR